MKELSIEEKAKRYDEAIERAKKVLLDCTPEEQNVVEYITSELRESKDERIRKALIRYFTLSDDNADYQCCGVHCKDVLAYLEKQGEPLDKIAQRARTEKQRVLLTETNGDANIDWDTRSLRDVKLLLEYGLDYIKKLEKQGEQKPAWSDEDERILNGLISSLARIGANTRTDSTSINYTFSREIDWLKSLKERYTWKPSDEQMSILWDALCTLKHENYKHLEIIKSLHQDLKKLKE